MGVRELKRLFNIQFCLGLAYVAAWTINAAFMAGEKCSTDTYSTDLPVGIFCFFGIPFLLGWMAGAKTERKR